MKAKRTIRKMRGYPLTRKLATYQRELTGMAKRLDKLVTATHDLEFEHAAAVRELATLRAASEPSELPVDSSTWPTSTEQNQRQEVADLTEEVHEGHEFMPMLRHVAPGGDQYEQM